MIVFVRSYIADFDARLGKYFKALHIAGLPCQFIGWNKDGRLGRAEPGFHYYSRRARLGAGWANLFALVGWNIYLLRQLVRLRAQVRVVHAVDLDTALAAWVFCKLFRRDLVFDLYDRYTAVRDIGGLPGRLIDSVEHFIACRAALTLIVAEERRAQHRLPAMLDNVLVLENVPQTALAETPAPSDAPPWKIGYFGVLEPAHRGLEDLLEACRGRSDVELHLAGYGGLADTCAAEAARSANVHFHGPMPSSKGLELMSRMDVVAGFYYLTVPNHVHASPNKYYEHLMLGRPLVTTDGTPPGARVVAEGTGWALRQGRAAIDAWLEGLDEEGIRCRGVKARALWDREYASYFERRYQGEYVSRLRSMLEASDAG